MYNSTYGQFNHKEKIKNSFFGLFSSHKRTIKKFTKKLDERRFYKKIYGKVFILDYFKIVFLVGFVVPVLDYVLMFLIKFYKLNKELLRIPLNDKLREF